MQESLKILVVGDRKTGKSKIISLFTLDMNPHFGYSETQGVPTTIFTLSVPHHKPYNAIEFIEVGSEDLFKKRAELVYKEVDGVLVFLNAKVDEEAPSEATTTLKQRLEAWVSEVSES